MLQEQTIYKLGSTSRYCMQSLALGMGVSALMLTLDLFLGSPSLDLAQTWSTHLVPEKAKNSYKHFLKNLLSI